jgi:hypothetical protein
MRETLGYPDHTGNWSVVRVCQPKADSVTFYVSGGLIVEAENGWHYLVGKIGEDREETSC